MFINSCFVKIKQKRFGVKIINVSIKIVEYLRFIIKYIFNNLLNFMITVNFKNNYFLKQKLLFILTYKIFWNVFAKVNLKFLYKISIL